CSASSSPWRADPRRRRGRQLDEDVPAAGAPRPPRRLQFGEPTGLDAGRYLALEGTQRGDRGREVADQLGEWGGRRPAAVADQAAVVQVALGDDEIDIRQFVAQLAGHGVERV